MEFIENGKKSVMKYTLPQYSHEDSNYLRRIQIVLQNGRVIELMISQKTIVKEVFEFVIKLAKISEPYFFWVNEG